MIKITFPNGDRKEFKEGITGREIAEGISKGLAKEILAMTLDGDVYDLNEKITFDAKINFLKPKDKQGIDVIRHSCSHLMAHAIKKLYPKATPTLGPVIEDGFYYDFDNLKIGEEDLKKIEGVMKELSKENYPIQRVVLKKADALKTFKNPFKQEIISEIKEKEVTAYEQGDFIDLCTGPHVPSTNHVKHFKLMKLAGSYWRGDAKNKMLTRIYGTAWDSEKSLKQYLTRLEEAEKRDHRKLGKQLDLFSFHEESPGVPFFHPKGAIIYNELQRFIREEYSKRGYQEVITPLLYDKSLWEKSGHWKHFQENMFVLDLDGSKHSLKPMNCPSHLLIFMNSTKSYRDLPLRIADFANLHRNELRGTLSGLTRVRKFVTDDCHVFCTEEQIKEETRKEIEFANYVFKIFNFKAHFELSTKPAKAMGTKEQWDKAETALKEVLTEMKIPYQLNEGDGAFYGPKIDFKFEDAIGRQHQLATVQIDFQMPQSFGAKYEGSDGKKHTPIMIHRAILGSIERFMGVYIEHTGGNFPFWLSPVQVNIMTVTDNHKNFAYEVKKELMEEGIRVEVDDRQETIGKKVREAQLQKIPFMITIGDKEVSSETLAIRTIDGKVKFQVKVTDFVKKCSELYKTRTNKTTI